MKENKDILNYIKVTKVNTPDQSYFDQLAQNIIDNEVRVVSLPFYKKSIFWSFTAAASIALIIVFSIFTTNKKTLVAKITADDIHQYIEENIADFDTETILEFVALENIDDTKTETKEESKSLIDNIKELDKKEILEYIESENLLDEFDENELYF